MGTGASVYDTVGMFARGAEAESPKSRAKSAHLQTGVGRYFVANDVGASLPGRLTGLSETTGSKVADDSRRQPWGYAQ